MCLKKNQQQTTTNLRNGIKCEAHYYDTDFTPAKIHVEQLEETIFRLKVYPPKTGKLRLRIEHIAEKVDSNLDEKLHEEKRRSFSSRSSSNKSMTILFNDMTQASHYSNSNNILTNQNEDESLLFDEDGEEIYLGEEGYKVDKQSLSSL
jgi:hypothetical protein